jgi:hypothetical protein
MCICSRPAKLTSTNIFARTSSKDRQFLVYEMRLAATEDLAMILPLPVPAKTGEDAVRWISLKDYQDFFEDLKRGFPEPATRGRFDGPPAGGIEAPPKPLAVVEVGDFEASFVPTLADFARLDERFRLPDACWKKLPTYADYGFAVFKLKSGVKKIHPMAFEFPRRDPKRLFFPTVHVHDGTVHLSAMFDHSLYCQKLEGDAFPLTEWRESPGLASDFVQKGKDGGLVAPEKHVHRLVLEGRLDNKDVLL